MADYSFDITKSIKGFTETEAFQQRSNALSLIGELASGSYMGSTTVAAQPKGSNLGTGFTTELGHRGALVRWDYLSLADEIDRVKYFCYDPDEITDSVSVSYETINIMGRSAPIFSYKGTEERIVIINLTLFAREEGTLREDVEGFCRWLKFFMYPIYTQGNLFPPSRIYLQLGSFLDVLGILTSYHPKFRGPYQIGSYYPYICDIPLEIKEVVSTAIDAREVAAGGRSVENYNNDGRVYNLPGVS